MTKTIPNDEQSADTERTAGMADALEYVRDGSNGWWLRMTATDLEHQARTLEAAAARLRYRAKCLRGLALRIDGTPRHD